MAKCTPAHEGSREGVGVHDVTHTAPPDLAIMDKAKVMLESDPELAPTTAQETAAKNVRPKAVRAGAVAALTRPGPARHAR